MAQKQTSRPRPRRRSVTLRIDEDSLFYFAELASETWIPYQTLINLYLRDCAQQELQIDLSWYPVQDLAQEEP